MCKLINYFNSPDAKENLEYFIAEYFGLVSTRIDMIDSVIIPLRLPNECLKSYFRKISNYICTILVFLCINHRKQSRSLCYNFERGDYVTFTTRLGKRPFNPVQTRKIVGGD